MIQRRSGQTGIVMLVLCAMLFTTRRAHAEDFLTLQHDEDAHSHYKLPMGTLIAAEDADAYDPFADYNEFEEATDEEADINFFRNGRFLTLSMIGGYRSFTGVLGQLYKGSMYFGAELTYFFDLRFALQMGYLDGSHGELLSVNGQGFTGTVDISQFHFDIKYFMTTQNVTRGLAKFNPYIVLGIAQVYRTNRIDGTDGYSRDQAMGLEVGAGFEIPLLRNKAFCGLEAVYEYVNFPDSGNQIMINGVGTGIFPSGQMIRAGGVLGLNF